MSGCNCALPNTKFNAAAAAAAFCPSTSTAAALPCAAPSYSRACLKGDPRKSPLAIERAGRAESLWTRSASIIVPPGGLTRSFYDVLFEAFTSSGEVCLTSVAMTITSGNPETTEAVPVTIVGIAGVWDFTDQSAVWTERVGIPCEVETDAILTTAGRCPCKAKCEGCLYPAAVGGMFMVRYRFGTIELPAGAVVRFTASGNHTATDPCCVMPVFLSEEEVIGVTSAAWPIQDQG